MEVVSLIEREWSCYGGGHFNGRRMVMLQRWSFNWREHGDTEVVTWRENGLVTEVVSLMEGEWSCHRSGHFNEGMYGRCYRPLLCTVKFELGWGEPGLMLWIWDETVAPEQYRSQDPPLCSSPRYQES